MTRIMRDSDAPSAIPRSTQIVAGYLTGPGTWPAAGFARFGNKPSARIDCRGTVPGKADVLDVEPGCSAVGKAVGWVRKRRAAYPGAYPPILYCNQSTLLSLLPVMRAAGLHLGKDFRLWIATLDGTKRIGDMTGVMAVQYKRAPNLQSNGKLERPSPSVTAGHYDESIVFDNTWHPGDDLPYPRKAITTLIRQSVAAELGTRATRQEILGLVRQGAAAQLAADLSGSGVTAARGAKAAVSVQAGLAGVRDQLTRLTGLADTVLAQLPPAASAGGTGTTPP
jgi:hypothetical protein